ncbi:hypothetical protein ASPCADRAFT_212326, partial [Aspergillus carbonarius ITEM 5010]
SLLPPSHLASTFGLSLARFRSLTFPCLLVTPVLLRQRQPPPSTNQPVHHNLVLHPLEFRSGSLGTVLPNPLPPTSPDPTRSNQASLAHPCGPFALFSRSIFFLSTLSSQSRVIFSPSGRVGGPP